MAKEIKGDIESKQNDWIDKCDSDLELENEIIVLKNINRRNKSKKKIELISNKKKIFSQLTKDSFKPTIKQR